MMTNHLERHKIKTVNHRVSLDSVGMKRAAVPLQLACTMLVNAKKTVHIFRMGHVRSSGPTRNSNSNESSSLSSVWGAASFRTGDGQHGEKEGALRGSGQGWYNGHHDGTKGPIFKLFKAFFQNSGRRLARVLKLHMGFITTKKEIITPQKIWPN